MSVLTSSTQEQNIRYKREHRAMAMDGYERKRKGEREGERRRNKKVKETNKRRIDIKEATRGDDARTECPTLVLVFLSRK